MTPVDLVRELARPARHDHRRLTTDQIVAENIARVLATGTILAAHTALRAANTIGDTVRTARVITHLWRHQ